MTGVQTCALPISVTSPAGSPASDTSAPCCIRSSCTPSLPPSIANSILSIPRNLWKGFVQQALGWVAFDKEAQEAISPIPLEVHFHHLRAFAGNGLTTPKYRGRGLLGLGSFMRMQLVRDKGFNSLIYAVATKNTAAQRGLARLSPRIYAKGRYIRVLWWKYWKETPCSCVDKEYPQVPSMIP